MALIQCPECGQQVSTEAAGCPHCGNPTPAPAASKSARKTSIIEWIMVALLLYGGYRFFAWQISGTDAPATPAASAPLTQEEKDRDAGISAVIDARDTVKTMLKDPDSAKFTHEFAVKTGQGAIVACGEVNAKNAFGGYAGASIYVAEGDMVRLENGANANDVRRRWNASCAKFPKVYDKPHL